MEHASAGAGADNNPVKRCLTNVFSCLWVQSQHFWDGLRKNKQQWRTRRCQANHSGPHLYLKSLQAIVPNKTKTVTVYLAWSRVSLELNCEFLVREAQQYLVLPAGCIDSCQTCSIQEAAVMQADADEVGGTVGGSAYEQPTTGHKMVNLEEETHYRYTKNWRTGKTKITLYGIMGGENRFFETFLFNYKINLFAFFDVQESICENVCISQKQL